MQRKWMVAAACAIVGAIVLWFTLSRPSEEDLVKKTLARFVKAVQVKQDDTLISRMGRLKTELKETVSDTVSVDVSEVTVRVVGREKLVEAAVQIPAVYSTAECDLTDLVVQIDEKATSAKVDGVAVVTGTRAGEKKTDKRDVHFLLYKIDGTWKITTLDVLPPKPAE